jgi:ketosteroid isomerase-like protein
MAHPNEDRFRAGYAAFQTGDMDALRNEYLTSDVVWHSPGNNPLSGDHKGIDDVLANFGKTMEVTGGTFRVELHDVLANDEHGVALATASGERNGKRIEDNYAHVVHFRDGKVAESWTHQWDPNKVDELFS